MSPAHVDAGVLDLFPSVDVAGCTSAGAGTSCVGILVGGKPCAQSPVLRAGWGLDDTVGLKARGVVF